MMGSPGFTVLSAALCLGADLACAGCDALPTRTEPAARTLSVADSQCPTAPGVLLPAADSAFGRAVVSEISTNAYYPTEAFDDRQQGQVTLCLRYGASGGVDRVLVKQSSGYPLLDGAAIYAAGRYIAFHDTAPDAPGRVIVSTGVLPTRFPTPPADLFHGQDTFWLEVPLAFRQSDSAASKTEQGPASPPQTNRCFPPPAVTSATPAALAAHYRTFVEGFQRRIERNLFFPRAAVASGTQGSALVFVVFADQRLQCASIQQSSGDALFDGVALLALGRTALEPDQVDTIAHLPQPALTVSYPFSFVLR